LRIDISVVMLLLVVLFYLSNPGNKVNQWSTLAGFFFWLGIVKQAVLFDVLPMLRASYGIMGLEEGYMPIHSVCTWIIYTLGMPTMTIAAYYFNEDDYGRLWRTRLFKSLMYVPALILPFIFSPLRFNEYQFYYRPFWITYAAYNFFFGALVAIIVFRNIRKDRNAVSRQQKKQVALVLLPPLYYWLFSVFIPNLLQKDDLGDLWTLNLFIMLVCLVVIIRRSFQRGFMGLKLVGQNYDWNTNMRLANVSAEYMSHFMKNQIAKMALCVELIEDDYTSSADGKEKPEEFTILTNSLSSLQKYCEKVMQHSQAIFLQEGAHRLNDILADAIAESLSGRPDIERRISIEKDLYLLCDKEHMTEVFANLLVNAADAVGAQGKIEVTGAYGKHGYHLYFTDNGAGIEDDILEKIFAPYFSTKNKAENFGLGLAYCKNAVEKHGGRISVKSARGEGTTFTVVLPSRRIRLAGEDGYARESPAQVYPQTEG